MRFRFCGDLDCPDWVLAEIATLSKLTSVRIKILVVQILSHCLEGSFNYEKVLKLAADNADGISDLKGSIAAVHFIVTNAAKHDLDEQSLVQEIQQLGLPKENSEAIARQYREHKDRLRLQLAESSYRYCDILSTAWRVDMVLASSANDKPVPIAHIKLTIDSAPHSTPCTSTAPDGVRVKEVAFELSAQKLDVLIHELTQAHAMMESLQN